MVKYRKIDPKKIEIVFSGLPLEVFQVPEPEVLHQTRSSLGISPDERVVVNVGRLDTQKGQIYLLQAASFVLKELPNTRFLIVGDGPDRQMLEEVARQEGLAERVIFTGYRTDIPALLGLTDVFAIPSLREGGPLTLFEAMSLRKPVVGTPTGLMPDFIREGENGFLVPIREVKLLASRLVFLLKNPDVAQEMGNKGWEACQQYDIQLSIRRFSQIYQSLVVSKGV
jgi:glycosyltransferase involved in cell wall biosynthesis